VLLSWDEGAGGKKRGQFYQDTLALVPESPSGLSLAGRWPRRAKENTRMVSARSCAVGGNQGLLEQAQMPMRELALNTCHTETIFSEASEYYHSVEIL
jgi:hypothetical protein